MKIQASVALALLLVAGSVRAQDPVIDYGSSLKCLNGVVSSDFLTRGNHEYSNRSFPDSILRTADGDLLIYPIEDKSQSGLWYFVTANGAYEISFEKDYPKFDYAKYQAQLDALDASADKNSDLAEPVMKKEGCDVDKIMASFEAYAQWLNKTNSNAANKKILLEGKLAELFANYPKSFALFKQGRKIREQERALRSNQPWTAGAPLHNYLVTFPSGLTAKIVPMINQNIYGGMHDGPTWHDVTITPASECGENECIPVTATVEAQVAGESIVNTEISERLSAFWQDLTVGPSGYNYNSIAQATAKNQEAVKYVSSQESRIGACTQVPGLVGSQAKSILAKMDQAIAAGQPAPAEAAQPAAQTAQPQQQP